MPSKEYHDKYRAKRNDLFGVFETVFKNPNQLSRILGRISGTSSAASKTKAISENKGSKIKKPTLDIWDKVVVGAQATALAVSNIDNVFDMAVGGSFYKKELGKLAITAKGGYELGLLSELKDLKNFSGKTQKKEYEKQFVAGKIYLSDDGKQASLRDLGGELRTINLKVAIDMKEFPHKRNNPGFIKQIFSSIPKQDYIYVYNSETPLFFIELLKDLKTEEFIKANSANINNLVTTQANSILSIVLSTIKDAVPKEGEPASVAQVIVTALEEGEVNAKFILDTVSPLIQPIVAELTANPERLNEFGVLAEKIIITSDKKEKAKFQKELLIKVASIDFARTQSIQALIDFFVKKESVANLTKIVEVVAPTLAARLAIPGIDAALIEGSVPIITKTASVLLGQTAELQSVGQYFTTATLATEETNAKLVKDLSSLVGALQAPQANFAGQLSSYVAGNHMQMRVVVKGFFNKNNEAFNEAEALNKVLNEELIDSAVDLVVKLSPKLLPSVLVLSKKILDKEASFKLFTRLVETPAVDLIYALKQARAALGSASGPQQGVIDLLNTLEPLIEAVLTAVEQSPQASADLSHVIAEMSLENDEQLKANYRKEVLAQGANLFLNNSGLRKALQDIFADEQSISKVKAITGKILDAPALAQRLATLGIEKHLILDAVPILGGTAGALLEKSIDVQGLIKYVYPNPSQPEMTQVQLFTHVSNILEGLKKQNDVFTSILPMYLKDNEILVLKAIEKKENLTVLRSNLKIPSDFSDELLLSVASGGLQVSQDLIPFAFKVASRALDASNKDSVIKIMEQAKKAFTPLAPMVKEKDGVELTAEQLKMQATKRNVDKQKKEKEISSLVNSVLNLKNNDPALKQLIDEGFPTILAKHSELLGGLLDEFLNKTTLGKYVDIRAKDYLEVASRHIPKLIDIAQLYNDKQYTRMILKASTLIFKKGVLVLAGKTMMRVLSYKYQAKSQSGFRHGLYAQEGSIRKKLSEMLAAAAVPANAVAAEAPRKLDLGAKLATYLGTGDSTLDYYLSNKDFTGIHFSFKPEVSLSNCILDGFTFNNAKLNTSFEGSEIRNCYFTGVVFTDAVSFKGAVIDERSLGTLIPAIKAYNDKHPDTPIINSPPLQSPRKN